MSQPNFDPAETGGGEQPIGQAGMFSQSSQDLPSEPEKLNPAWNDLLSVVPDQNLQKLIVPQLKKWDQSHNSSLEKVHSEYAPYKPFKEAGIDPERLNQALLIYESMEKDPQKFVNAVAEFYKVQLGQGQQPEEPQQYNSGEEQQPFDLTQHPDWQRQQAMVEQLAQGYIAQQEQVMSQQDDEALDAELAEAHQQFGDFDEAMVLQQMLYYDLSAVDAVKKLQEYNQQVIQSYRSPGSQAPIIAGGGGGLPSQQTPVGQLDSKSRKQMMAEALARAHAPGR